MQMSRSGAGLCRCFSSDDQNIHRLKCSQNPDDDQLFQHFSFCFKHRLRIFPQNLILNQNYNYLACLMASPKRIKPDQSVQRSLFAVEPEADSPPTHSVPKPDNVRASTREDSAPTLPSATDTSVVICGSYRKNPLALAEIYQNFLDLHCRILSPSNVDIQREEHGFVYMRGEETQTPEVLERRHLDAIERADFVWLHAPDGYVGLSASLEIGYANAIGTPVFSASALQDAVLTPLVKVVDGPASLVPAPRHVPPAIPKPAISRFQNYYRKVAIQRGYEGESAQNCLLLMVEEFGELSEAIRKREKIARHGRASEASESQELADVFLYVVHMANILGLDLGSAVRDKEEINLAKFVGSRRKLHGI
jgi:NTP pyrophosphatase (non-canonical NTP hydrolase)